MNKHILIAFGFLSLLLLSLSSCQQETIEGVVPEEARTAGIHLNIETGKVTEIDRSQLNSTMLPQQQDEIEDRGLTYTYSNFRYHESDGEILNAGHIKRLRWYVTHDYATGEVTGKVNKFRLKTDLGEIFDFDLDVVCNFVNGNKGNIGVFMGEITDINEVPAGYQHHIKEGDFVYFSLRNGRPPVFKDYISDILIITPAELESIIGEPGFEKELCFVVGKFGEYIDEYYAVDERTALPADSRVFVQNY